MTFLARCFFIWLFKRWKHICFLFDFKKHFYIFTLKRGGGNPPNQPPCVLSWFFPYKPQNPQETRGVYHILKSFGNFGWNVNGKAILVFPNRKLSKSWKMVQDLQPQISERKMCLPFAIFTSSKPYSNVDANHVSFSRRCANGTRQSRSKIFIGDSASSSYALRYLIVAKYNIK